MSQEDNVGEYLKSKEHKDKMKQAHSKASELQEKYKEEDRPRPRRTPQEAQMMIDQQREMVHNENMQPPPPPEFTDEFGKPIFEDQSDINFGGSMMPRRFKGERAGLKREGLPGMRAVPGSLRDSTSDSRQSALNQQKMLTLPRDSKEFVQRETAPPQMTMKQMSDNDREFSHTTDLTFRDLTTEQYREYMYNNGGVLRILQPWKLAISRSGNHRVATVDGFSYIIVPGWIAIRIKKKVGAPAFTF